MALNVELEIRLAKARAHIDSLTGQRDRIEAVSDRELVSARHELATLREQAGRREKDVEFRLRHAQMEAEAATKLNETLREVVAAREADEKKNAAMMQLLHTQLDESMKRQQSMLADEQRRCREVKAELGELQAQAANTHDENLLLKLQLESVKQDAAAAVRAATRISDEAKEWIERANAEFTELKQRLTTDLGAAHARGGALGEDNAALHIKLEAATMQVAALERALRKSDRDASERVAFLNAQIASERAMIDDLVVCVQQLNADHDALRSEASRAERAKHAEIADASRSLLEVMKRAEVEREKEHMSRAANDAHFRGRINDMEAAMRKAETLKVSQESHESELDVAMSELARLEALLDEHFIVHRRAQLPQHSDRLCRAPVTATDPMPVAQSVIAALQRRVSQATIAAAERRASGAGLALPPAAHDPTKRRPSAVFPSTSVRRPSVVSGPSNGAPNTALSPSAQEAVRAALEAARQENDDLRAQLDKAEADMEVQRRIGLEVETRLSTQVKNQYQIVDALHHELAVAKQEHLKRVHELEKEKHALIMKSAVQRLSIGGAGGGGGVLSQSVNSPLSLSKRAAMHDERDEEEL